MSTSTYIEFLNANDPKFLAATSAGFESLEKWEDDHGPVADRPGAKIPEPPHGYDAVEETGEEYGGWVIDLSKLPVGTTHVRIWRG